MKIGTDSVICRIVEADGLISVTHTLKDQTGRRISDIHSVADLVQTLPSLTAPIIEAIPYEAHYYDKWARVPRNEATSRASIRPVTVTAKSWTLLHSVPTATQASLDAPASPRRHLSTNSRNPSISSCKSLDSIIEHYNKLFPNDNEKGTKCNMKVAKHEEKTTKRHEQSIAKTRLQKQQPNSGEIVTATDNLTQNSSQRMSRNIKSISRTPSPNRAVSISPSMDKSALSTERGYMADKSSKKNTLQVPLPTGLVSIEWPSAIPTSDNCHKATQFPVCSPKKYSNQVIPRIKTPDLRERDISPSQRNNSAVAKKMEELKLMQISSSSLVASHNSRRHSFEQRSGNIVRCSPGLSPEPRSVYLRRYSTQSNVTLRKEDTLDCRSTSIQEHNTGEIDIISAGRSSNSGDILHSRERKSPLNLPVDHLAPINNSPREVSQERNQALQSVCTNTGRRLDVIANNSGKGPKSCRKRRPRSRKLLQENNNHLPGDREGSSKSTHSRHRRNGPPMVQFLDLKDLQAIFDKAAKVRQPSDIVSEEVYSL